MTANEHENSPFPTFDQFYRAVNGRDPFPWQARLAEEVARTETWPSVGVQTGLGKTACLDIAVWWLASQADRPPAERTTPTRIWWVVNRRLLVDSTAEHAERLACLLDGDGGRQRDNASQAVAAVGTRLRSLSATSVKPLQVIRLRGGLTSRTPTDPSVPAIILCTLPMYGSRLLFRGYGSKLRAIDAAMAGTDSLVLLDEAHLAPHLEKLLPALAECTPGAHSPFCEARSQARLVSLTATSNQVDGAAPFLLDADDEANPVVRQRLDATKPLALRECTGDGARCLADAAHDLLGEAPALSSCLVFANTPKTARAVFNRLKKQYDGKADVLLLTGLVREREAECIRRWILDPDRGMPANNDAAKPREKHLIVVATQTLEVGADVDAEYLVTENCGVRALTQRLGRLNRLGRHSHARAIYVHVPPKPAKGAKKPSSATWPIYGEEPAVVWQRLQGALGDDRTVDLAPRHVRRVLGAPLDDPPDAPEVLPGLLWEWIKTTTPPEGEAPVEPYFSGIEGPDYTVSLIWRIHVPEQGARLWPRATDREAIDVPLRNVRDVLEEEEVQRLGADGATVETVSATQLRPGDRVVLPAQRGLMDEFGWNPEAKDPVVDVSLASNGLPLDSQALEHLCGVRLKQQIAVALGAAGEDDEDVDPDAQQEAAREVLEAVRAAETPAGWDDAEWTAFVGALVPRVVQARGEVPRLRVEKPQPEPRSIEFDETSLSPEAVELGAHGAAVGERARSVAASIGLPPHLCEVVEVAGRAHDIGKADQRFQRWLDPKGRRHALVAKSSTPRHRWEQTRAAAGWPRGGRHEALSAWLVEAWLEQVPAWGNQLSQLAAEERQAATELLVHLVISHHGKGRPLVRPVEDDTLAEVCGVVEGVRVRASANLSRVDWNQPARFKRLNDRFGPWGLALLEAILIRADHAVSAGTNFDWDPL